MKIVKWLAPLALALGLSAAHAQTPTWTKLNQGIARNVSPNQVGIDIGASSTSYVPIGTIVGGAFLPNPAPISNITGLGTNVAGALATTLNANGGFAAVNGAPTSGNCLKWSATGIQDAGVCSPGTLYVSSTNSNGVAAGNDATANGSKNFPYATLEAARAVAQPGQEIKCNGSFTPTTFHSVTTSFTLNSVVDYGCTITLRSGQAQVFNLNPAASSAVTFGKVIIDGANNSGGSGNIVVANTSSKFTLTFNGTRLKDFYSYGLTEGSAGKFDVTGSLDCSASAGVTCVQLPTHADGNVTLSSLTGTVTNRAVGNGASFIYFKTSAAGPTVTTSYLNITGVPANNSSIYRLIRTVNAKNAIIDGGGGTVAMNSTDTAPSCRPIEIESDTTAPLDSSGARIRNMTLRPNCSGGGHAGATIGFDGDPGVSYRNYVNDSVIENITVYAGANVNSTNITEGLFCGWQTNCIIRKSYVSGLYDAVEIKGCTGCYTYSVVSTGLTNAFATIKYGSGNYLVNNLHYETTNPASATCFVMLSDGGTGSPTTGNYVTNNVAAYYIGSTNVRRFVCQSGTGNTATFTNNDWYNQSGLSSGYPFQYAGTTYASVAAWTAIEASAIGTDPQIVNFGAAQYGVQPGSPAAFGGATVPASVTSDYTGAAFANPPSIGAVQFQGLNGSNYAQVGVTNTFTAVQKFPAGSASAPPIYFGTDTNTGFFQSSTGIWDWAGAGTAYWRIRSSQNQVGSGVANCWSSTAAVGTCDTFLYRNGAANIRQGAADAASPVAQTRSVQSVVAGTSNTSGADTTFTGSQGTGTGVGGSMIFKVAPAGSSGTAQNSLVEAFRIDGTTGLPKLPEKTVATLPTCNSGARNHVAGVTDGAAALAWGATVSGGGSASYGVRCNGTNWTVFSN